MKGLLELSFVYQRSERSLLRGVARTHAQPGKERGRVGSLCSSKAEDTSPWLRIVCPPRISRDLDTRWVRGLSLVLPGYLFKRKKREKRGKECSANSLLSAHLRKMDLDWFFSAGWTAAR